MLLSLVAGPAFVLGSFHFFERSNGAFDFDSATTTTAARPWPPNNSSYYSRFVLRRSALLLLCSRICILQSASGLNLIGIARMADAEVEATAPAHTPFGDLSQGAKDELIIGLAALVCHDSEKESTVRRQNNQLLIYVV